MGSEKVYDAMEQAKGVFSCLGMQNVGIDGRAVTIQFETPGDARQYFATVANAINPQANMDYCDGRWVKSEAV